MIHLKAISFVAKFNKRCLNVMMVHRQGQLRFLSNDALRRSCVVSLMRAYLFKHLGAGFSGSLIERFCCILSVSIKRKCSFSLLYSFVYI